jgi:hypothetical protein
MDFLPSPPVVHYLRLAPLRIGLGGARLLVLTSEANGKVPPDLRQGARCDQLIRGVDEIQSFAKMAFGAIKQILG